MVGGSEQVRKMLVKFDPLYVASDNNFLGSGSLDIINGITLSCDGSHYTQAGELLQDECKF